MTLSTDSRSRFANVEAFVDITIAPDAPDDVITRVTGPTGDAWRSQAYPLHTESDVIEHWARNAVNNGIVDACQLDGWADLPAEAVMFTVSVNYVEAG